MWPQGRRGPGCLTNSFSISTPTAVAMLYKRGPRGHLGQRGKVASSERVSVKVTVVDCVVYHKADVIFAQLFIT